MKKKLLNIIIGAFFVALIPLTLSSCNDEKKDEIKEVESNTCNVEIDYNDGSEVLKYTLNKNEKINVPQIKSREGYSFIGWYLNDLEYDFNSDVTNDIKLVAKWRADSTVSYFNFTNSNRSEIETEYDDSYFDLDSNQYNKNLAEFSFYQSSINSGDNTIVKFLKFYGFDNFKQLKESDSDYVNVAYTFAHKKIGNVDLINLAIRGFYYNTEWSGNFDLGESGNHKDFYDAATRVYQALKDYISQYDNNIKILINGYSRAGAIANCLASMILEDGNKIIDDINLYVYTIEAPGALMEENAKPYNNVYNIINSADLVIYVPPKELGFMRCGIDVEINNGKLDELVNEYNPDLSLPKFKKVTASGFDASESDKDFPNTFINVLLNYEADKEENEIYEIKDRQSFVNNISNKISYVIELAFTIKPSTRNQLLSDLRNNYSLIDYYLLLTSPETLKNFLEIYLKKDNIIYDEGKLLNSCESIIGLINSNLKLYELVISYSDNFKRMLNQHLPIYNYLYLKAYNSQF